MRVKRALVSVSDKTGIVEFAKALNSMGVEIVSTGGTASMLIKEGIEARMVEEFTSFKEMLGGRVKTLHPKIHGGLLAVRTNDKHMKEVEENQIPLIDMVVVNLYPFKKTVSDPKVELDAAIENIDIGGPTMIRSAAKNHKFVAVVTNPEQYEGIVKEMSEKNGNLSLGTLQNLAFRAFEHTANYDAAIQAFLRQRFEIKEKFPKELVLGYDKVYDCRYGENPHQEAAFYRDGSPLSIADAEILNGKQLSFNNINDLSGAVNLCREFTEPCVVIVKHANPCGCAVASEIPLAFAQALESDPVSAFGGIIAMNRICGLETAKQITSFFNEIVVAPDFEHKALEELKTKKNLRVLKWDFREKSKDMNMKKVTGGILLQDEDNADIKKDDLKMVSETKPSEGQIASMLFGLKVVKHVKSNAIILVQGTKTVGIGAGQMSRVDSVDISIKKAKGKEKGAVLVSDAFFPFRDSIDNAAKAGIGAIIEPGGSIKDDEVIAAANEHRIPLVFTGVRHFLH